jgi:shikimate dehydrogenase
VITGKTKLLGVIGDPIGHSLSPVMHNAALAALSSTTAGLSHIYLPFAIRPEDLATAIAGFCAIGIQGFNVTIPHKQAILTYLSDVDELAQMVGAVNTVWRTEQGWQGTNTDVLGFLAPLKTLNLDWSQMPVTVLGQGGAARAVVVACVQLGCSTIAIVGRDPSKLQKFLESWPSAIAQKLHCHTWDTIPDLLTQTVLLVNTTPIGMSPHAEQSPLDEMAIAQLPSHGIVYDLIYNPRPTRLLGMAQARGLIAIDGLEMLVQQGAAALARWIDQPVPIDAMRMAAMHFLEKI